MENLVYEPKKVMINGKEHTVKRLGLQNVFQFIRILKSAGIVHQFSSMIRDMDVKSNSDFVPLTAEQIKEFDENEKKKYDERLAEWEAGEVEREEERQERMIQTALNLFMSVEDAEKDVYPLLATLIDLPEADTKLIPPDVAVEIIEAIVKAPDIKSFFNAIKKLLPKDKKTPEAAKN